MRPAIDMRGLLCGNLTVLTRIETPGGRGAFWLCRCDCGKEVILNGTRLRSGKATGCGCRQQSVVDMAGQLFTYLTVVQQVPSDIAGRAQWLCLCKCGKHTIVRGDCLRDGNTTSCGCRNGGDHTPTHNLSSHPLYKIYLSMLDRCYITERPYYHRYGGRGITVCERWLGEDGLQYFVEDMYPTYKQGLSIDRIDNDGDYEPTNCRWSTPKEQARNKRDTIMVEYKGRRIALIALCEELNIPRHRVISRLRMGWDIVKAIEKESRRYNVGSKNK